MELPFECLLFHALVTLLNPGNCNVTNIFRLKGLATMHPEVTGYILIISRYLLCAYYVQKSLLCITELPGTIGAKNKTKTCTSIQERKGC